MLCGSIVLAVAAVVSGELAAFRPEAVTANSVSEPSISRSSAASSRSPPSAWVLRHAPLPLISTYAFVNPVVAVFLGWLILHETVTPLQLLAGAGIVVGVALLILGRSRMAAPRPVARPVTAAEVDEAAAA